jgi:hypothetical protein
VDAKAILSLLTSAELTLWLLALSAAIYARLHKHLVAVICFLGSKLVVAATYSYITLHYPVGSQGWERAYGYYYDVYWMMYLVATVAAFFSIEQIMRRVLSPLPGVSRLAVLIFRFTGILTFFIAITAHLTELSKLPLPIWINSFFISIALCMCVFEVSLMSMLIAAAPRLGLSFRTRFLGLSLGLCFLGITDFTSLMAWMAGNGGAWAGLNLPSELVIDLTLVMWIAYFVLPDQKRGPLRLTRSSTLMRWNDIVNQLGIGPQPVVELAPSFMTDVEMVVERIMMRNPGHKL